MSAATDQFRPQVPADLSLGARWTFTDPNTGEVRHYVLHSYHARANSYKLYNVATFPDGPPDDGNWTDAAWATPGTLRGFTGTKGWSQG